jgi:hypothetical protein
MAYSYQEFLADGQTVDFTIPFTYVKPSEVAVYVDGEVQETFEFTSGSTVQLPSAPANGTIVRISRTTDLENRAVDFVAGAVLSEEDLDTALQQVFNGAQEAVDKTFETIAKGFDGSFDGQGRILSNIADPENDQDAVNKRTVIALTATSVTAASNSASAAAGSAGTANTRAIDAGNSADDASGYANDASGFAQNASTSYTNTVGVYNQTLAALDAAKIPASLSNKAKQFLQVKADETGYELVASVAAPVFFGFKAVNGGLEMTYGRDDTFNAEEFVAWTLAENVSFQIQNNNLVVVL